MPAYTDLSGNSGVDRYECGDDWIEVQFRGGASYVYNYASAGAIHVERMKQLARAGRGLSSYISRHVRGLYARKVG